MIAAFGRQAAATGRLPLPAAADHSSPDPVFAASPPQASWHRAVTRSRRRQAHAQGVQAPPDRVLPRRNRRGADRGRQAAPLRRERPDVQVRLPRTAREARTLVSGDFLRRLILCAHQIHTVLTDKGIQFTMPVPLARPCRRSRKPIGKGERSEPTPSNPPVRGQTSTIGQQSPSTRTNGQVERMNRTIKDATVIRDDDVRR